MEIMIEEDQFVNFHNPVVRQERNNLLLEDFKDEVARFIGSSDVIERLLDVLIGGLNN